MLLKFLRFSYIFLKVFRLIHQSVEKTQKMITKAITASIHFRLGKNRLFHSVQTYKL